MKPVLLTLAVGSAVTAASASPALLTPSQVLGPFDLQRFVSQNPGYTTQDFSHYITDGTPVPEGNTLVNLPLSGQLGPGMTYEAIGPNVRPSDFRQRDGNFDFDILQGGAVLDGVIDIASSPNTLSAFTITFDQVQTSVGLTLIGPGPSPSSPGLNAWVDGQFINIGQRLALNERNGYVFIVFEDPDGFSELTLAAAQATNGFNFETFFISDITYNNVPAPGAAVLAAAGGLTALRRRR